MACGATHDLYINNAGDKVISNSVEIHRLFGKDAGTFINTTSGDNTWSVGLSVNQEYNK